MNNGIRISYPRTVYMLLNEKMKDDIEDVIEEFMEYAKEPIQENFAYTLDISYDEYQYQNFLSVVFYVSMNTGGAHPDNRIFSLSYDIKKKELITIEDLMKMFPNILTILSEESRKSLSQNPKIVNREMMMEGTMPKSENFSIFAFSPTGLLLFFPQYQVAPYSSGSFKIIVPYQKLLRR